MTTTFKKIAPRRTSWMGSGSSLEKSLASLAQDSTKVVEVEATTLTWKSQSTEEVAAATPTKEHLRHHPDAGIRNTKTSLAATAEMVAVKTEEEDSHHLTVEGTHTEKRLEARMVVGETGLALIAVVANVIETEVNPRITAEAMDLSMGTTETTLAALEQVPMEKWFLITSSCMKS